MCCNNFLSCQEAVKSYSSGAIYDLQSQDAAQNRSGVVKWKRMFPGEHRIPGNRDRRLVRSNDRKVKRSPSQREGQIAENGKAENDARI